ncbi:MAG: hypothetical protein K2N25_01165, partial [Muribaculaceae bacterium]|nr:hypothetical protein [Muribaculaceae bacterium]
VFHDFTYSDGNYKNQVAIGFCFYIDPKDETRRLMVSTQDLSTGIHWGIYPGSADLEGFSEIELADTPGYEVFNTPVSDLSGVTHFVTDASYRDENTDDGFKEFTEAQCEGDIGFFRLPVDFTFHGVTYPRLSYIPRGFYKTLQIIKHRDTILQDSDVALDLPQASADETELQCLNRLMSEIVLINDNDIKWRQLYYPAASLCHHFQPSVRNGLVLNDRFKAGMWFLPAIGDLIRCYWHDKERNAEGSQDAIFQKWAESGLFNAWRSSWYWSAAEGSSHYAWYIDFSNGYLHNYSKFNARSVRAMAAF